MTQQTFIKQFQQYLNNNSDKHRAKQEKAYLYSDLKHYGVSIWQLRKFFSQHQKDLKNLSKPKTLSLVKRLWNRASHEDRTATLFILNLHKEKLTINDMSLIEKLMRESRGWALLDSLIIPLMPEIINRDKKAYDFLKKWIKDNDFWVRRSALLAQLLFFRQNKNGNQQLFFALAKSQFDESWIDKVYKNTLDRQRARFFIRKAIGWVLREMSQKQPKVVLEFLKKYKSQMSGLSFREASRKLPPRMKKLLNR